MRYAEFISKVQQEAGGVDVDFIRAVISASLGVEKPMSAHYSEDDLRVVLEALRGARGEGRAPARPEYRFITAPALEGWWFRSSSYVIKDDLWIEPAPGAKLEKYPFEEEALTELVIDLEELGRYDRVGGLKGISRFITDGRDTDQKAWEKEPPSPTERDRVLAFYAKHGPLGLMFRGVFGYSVFFERLSHVLVDFNPIDRPVDCHEKLFKHFGPYLRREKYFFHRPPEDGGYLPCWDPRGRIRYFSLRSLYMGYREDFFSVSREAGMFSGLARKLSSGVVPGFLIRLEEALANSRPVVELEARQPARLSVRWEPTSLLDAAYLRLFSLGVGGMRICEDPKCGRLFTPQGKRRYCSDRCSERHRKERNRKRQPAI